MRYNTRIAPSPTGFMHIGTARTALFNWLAARSTGGSFLLRIDDTDTERNNPDTVDPIIQGLTWLGLDWDDYVHQSTLWGGPHSYNFCKKCFIDPLVAKGYAIPFENGATALLWQPHWPRVWHDEVVGEVKITDTIVKNIHGRLILNRGFEKNYGCVYNFCSIVDDIRMNINFIIRGKDHIDNTPKQLAIKWALEEVGAVEKTEIKFAHVGLIFHNKKKMSKRDGAASLLDYRDKGIHPDAMFNALLRLGWGPHEDSKENSVLTRDRALELFLTKGNMKSREPSFDMDKLNWYNRVFSSGKNI